MTNYMHAMIFALLMDFAPLKTFLQNYAWDGKTQSVSFFEYIFHITHREVFENATSNSILRSILVVEYGDEQKSLWLSCDPTTLISMLEHRNHKNLYRLGTK